MLCHLGTVTASPRHGCAAVRSHGRGDRKGVAVGVAEGEHGGSFRPAEDVAGFDSPLTQGGVGAVDIVRSEADTDPLSNADHSGWRQCSVNRGGRVRDDERRVDDLSASDSCIQLPHGHANKANLFRRVGPIRASACRACGADEDVHGPRHTPRMVKNVFRRRRVSALLRALADACLRVLAGTA